MKKISAYFSKFELALWIGSASGIILAFLIFDGENYLSLIASLIGVSSLVFYAKGNPIGHAIGIVFCILYAIISYSFSYYGEMITYLCMSLPMAIIALVSWTRNPYKNNKAEVKINSITKKEFLLMWIPTILVTVAFYFILKYFGTANLLPSTFSVATSFAAVYLCSKRTPYYALAYVANDAVLIVLWLLASLESTRYISMLVCFIAFLFNDIYGFTNWQRMKRRQSRND